MLQKTYMQFKDIPSNNIAKQHLLKSIKNDRLRHAHMFLGRDGSSSLAIAWAFAQYILCDSPSETDSCGKCPSCIKCAKLNHADFHWIFPVISGQYKSPISDNYLPEWRDLLEKNNYPTEEDWYLQLGKNNKQGFISVHEANELIRKTTLKPFEGSYRVIIIWHSEKMNKTTANKLLKLLEEPPKKTIFILLTNNSEDLLATIVSRLQMIKIEHTDKSSLSNFLQKKYNVKIDLADEAAEVSGGNIGKAISAIIGNDLLEENTQQFQNWMRICYQAKMLDLASWVDLIDSWGRERQKGFLQYALKMIREGLIQNFGHKSIKKVRKSEALFIKNFAPYINQNNAFEIIEELESAHMHIEGNGRAKIIFMDLTLKISILIRVKNLTLQSSND